VPNTSRSSSVDLVRDYVRDSQPLGPDMIPQLRLLLTEQSQHLDRLRVAIVRVGQSLAEIDAEPEEEVGQRYVPLLRAQAEAIQGLTLLAIKGQNLQAETVAALELLTEAPPLPTDLRWAYPLVALSVVLSLIALLF
jgi:hypothetical protein